MSFTRKEKQFLVFITALALGVALITRIFNIPILTLNVWVNSHPEVLLLFFPVGLYFTLDKERLQSPPT